MLTVGDDPKPGRQRENDQCDSKNASQRLGDVAGTSNENGIKEPNKTTRGTREGWYSGGQKNLRRGQGATGKVLAQLRELRQSHLEFIDTCTGTLQKHRNLFQENMDSLEQEILEAINNEEE